ncbi:hypothetical protein [Limoniibacter endophyticus]|uniref:Uncharacterized protein n=1 Tax=Limoniibacter endophyticus TaxID=1565040 RepID=A0A8J3DLT8_9HYPH|nr:hypothetical protein [Limoniibacter endophyticus]GHC61466.1 hypothetical protein GCM10010136_02020 [Limoniibacter endophyticus]
MQNVKTDLELARDLLAYLRQQPLDWDDDINAVARCLDKLVAFNDLATPALEFYRDAFQLHPKRGPTGINHSEWLPKPALLEDCGNKALDALAAIAKATGDAA